MWVAGSTKMGNQESNLFIKCLVPTLNPEYCHNKVTTHAGDRLRLGRGEWGVVPPLSERREYMPTPALEETALLTEVVALFVRSYIFYETRKVNL